MKLLGYITVFISAFMLTNCSTNKVLNPSQLFTDKVRDWTEEGEATWNLTDGVLTGSITEGTGFVITKASYSDFELTLDFKPDSTINSGVFILCQQKVLSASDCHEINIWDLHPNQDFRTGAIVSKVKPLKKVNTLEKWNTYKIRIKAGNISVWVNDELTAKYKDDTLSEGFIALQAAGNGMIQFRNVMLQKI